MTKTFKTAAKLIHGLCFYLLLSPLAQAHLMVAQHGTLNIVDDGAFMVLSLAISSFQGIDDDQNGDVSVLEFNRHRTDIVHTIKLGITLRDGKGNCPLEGIMLSPVMDHQAHQDSISQLTIMGRFTLAAPATPLVLHIDLYGKQPLEKTIEVSARRNTAMEVNQFSPTSPEGKFFAE